MNTISNNKLGVSVREISDTAFIYLSGQFTFNARHVFKDAYQSQLSNSKVGSVVIDFSGVEYLDSSALGMLLVLRDHIQASGKSLSLSKPSAIAARTFDIAGFQGIFTIN